jgi:SAM-dependent methyltransferase
MKTENCIICGSTLFKHLKTESVKYHSEGSSQCLLVSYEICKSCGHVQQNPLLKKERYHELPCCFPKDYQNHAYRRADYIMDFLKPFIKENSKILDVGCGPGLVMKGMSYYNHDCYGYTLINETLNPKIDEKDVETDDLNWKDFDVICMTHVAEHFLNPIQTISKVSQLLSENGIIYIEVPSFTWGEVRSDNIFTPEHISFFTKNALINTAILSGLTPIRIKESKYWGNIKMVCKKTKNNNHLPLNFLDDVEVIWYRRFIKLLYPIYSILKKVRNVGPNE